ncbi:MAG: CHAP domain-containing protein [Muribaculaceae bacterium]|nr:CHAP domain-containing protein [Muribaculaceae bacterium]
MTLGFMPGAAYTNPILAPWLNGGTAAGNTSTNTSYGGGITNYQYPLLDFANGRYVIPKFSTPTNSSFSFNRFGSCGGIPIFELPGKKSSYTSKRKESQGLFDTVFSYGKKAWNFIKGIGKSILNTAAKYLGFNEKNGSYKKFTNGRTEAWCADFVTYVVKEAFRAAGKPIPKGFGSPSVSGLMSWGKSQAGRWVQVAGKSNRASIIKSNVKPGDIIIFKSAGASHTGLVESIASDGTIHTIEGNTSDRVAQRKHSPNKATITGFIKMA